MDVLLYNSNVCRFCGEENENGSLLFSPDENGQSLCDLINTYLPLKVSDDGQLPCTLCPGCTIQLEATVEFFNLIINGQKIIRELYQKEKAFKKSLQNKENTEIISVLTSTSELITEKNLYQINTSDGVFQVDHPISLLMAGLDKPKRKRGRPPKKVKTSEELQNELAEREKEIAKIVANQEVNENETPGKRRRKAPNRFREAVQGKELERIFKEEGVIDAEEKDPESKAKIEVNIKVPEPEEPEVIGHLQTSGEPVVVIKGKGRGRPKGSVRARSWPCSACGAVFACAGRYMSHVAAHGHACRDVQREHMPLTAQDITKKQDLSKEGTFDPPQPPKDPLDVTGSEGDVIQLDLKKETPDNTGNTETSIIEELVNNIKSDVDKLIDVEASPSKTEPGVSVPEGVDVPDEGEEQLNETKGKPRLKCNMCEKTFSNRQSKSMHMKTAHGGRRYGCGECGATFPYPRSLALHALRHRREERHRGFACDLCGKVLSHPSSVVYHKEAVHGGRRYLCLKCGKSFKHKQLLQRHQLVHSVVRPYNCKTCSATFKTKANLANHQMLHSGVKKFSCEVCKQRFAHKTSLTLHVRLHTGLKPFSCNVCGKSFSQKGNLSEHVRIHTGEKPYSCSECTRSFTTSSQHRLHVMRHAHSDGAKSSGGGGAAAAEGTAACETCQRVGRQNCDLCKNKKQVKQKSLLVDKKRRSPRVKLPIVEPQPEVKIATPEPEMDERVIYVTYDIDETEAPSYILDESPVTIAEDKVLSSCELYTGESLLVHEDIEAVSHDNHGKEEDEVYYEATELGDDNIVETQHMAVTDEQGNPLHFTMQDGTRLAITSVDGKSLQVITQDGQTIPVEINGYNEDDDEEVNIEDDVNTVVHQLNIQKTADSSESTPVAHYFTIV